MDACLCRALQCANGYVMNEVLRGRWNRSDALITTDCGAVGNLLHEPLNAASPEAAAAMALNNGTDIEMGGTTVCKACSPAVAFLVLRRCLPPTVHTVR